MSILLLSVFAATALFTGSALVICLLAGERSAASVRLNEVAGTSPAKSTTSGKVGLGGIVSLLASPLAPFRNWLRANDSDLADRLSLAGYRNPEDVETYLTAKALAPIVAVLLATFTGAENFLVYGLMLVAASFFAPDIFLFYAIGKRKRELNLALPDATDLLVICMEAGLGLDQAVLRVTEEMQNYCVPLAEELLLISREQRAGKPRIEAWRSMGRRVDLDTIRQFVAMLAQTDKLGTPIAKALGQFADALRTKRLLNAEENAAKTTIKLVFPLVFFIFPAMFVVLLGPAAITLMQSLSN